jgi:hypothetical protein
LTCRKEKNICHDKEIAIPIYEPPQGHIATVEEGELPMVDGELQLKTNSGNVNDNDDTTPLKSNDRHQDNGPSEDIGVKACQDDNITAVANLPDNVKSQEQEMIQEKVIDFSSTVAESANVHESEVTVHEKMKDTCFPPPVGATLIGTAAADQSEQDLTEKKKKKRGPLSIHIGLPGAKRKKLIESKPQDESSVANAKDTFTTISEISTRNRNVGDDLMEVDKPSLATTSYPKTNYASLDVASLTGNEVFDDSLSDGEIQEDGKVQEVITSIMEVGPKEVRHYFCFFCCALDGYATNGYMLTFSA